VVFKDVTSFGYPIDLASCQNATTSSPNTVGFFLAVISAPGYWTNEKSSAKALSRSARKNNATGCCAVVVQLVSHGFVVSTLTQERDI
jgi:hypothetical protein